jgi:hypothetical protein
MTDDETWQQIEAARDIAALYDERAHTAAWLDQQDFPPLEWTVEGILPEGMGLLAAPPKVGKSWLVNNIALACAAGGLALGAIPVKRRPVLLLALEDGQRRLKSRFQTLMERQPLPEGLVFITAASAIEAPTIIMEFLRRHLHAAPLVIVDTLGKIKPPRMTSEDPYQADYRFGGNLKACIDTVPGACLLLVHHTRKAETHDFIDSVSGTQGIAGSADFVLVLTRRRHATEAILSVTGRDVPEGEYALRTHEGRWTLDGLDLLDAADTAAHRRETSDLSDRSADALAFVNCRPLGTRPGDLAKHLGIDGDTAGRYLRRLSESDRIAKRTRGIYIPLSVPSEVSETDDETDTTDTTDTTSPGHRDFTEPMWRPGDDEA